MSLLGVVSAGVRNPGRTLAAIRHRLMSAVGHDGFRRFIVLSRSRTGSNLLISLLDSHPDIRAEGEIFAKLEGRNYEDVLRQAWGRQPFNVKAKGFKIFYYHPLDDESCGLRDDLVSMDDLYVIHLKRRNILRTLVSRKIAGLRDVWLVSSDNSASTDRKDVSVSFTMDELNEAFRQTREWEEAADHDFRNHPLLSIAYEDLADGPTAAFRTVTDFLGVRYMQPATELRKQNTRTLEETIANYDELKEAFARTEWAPFFED
jgi:LPS sulfotransferase NodH